MIPRKEVLTRLGLAGLVLVLAMVGYNLIGRFLAPERAVTLMTDLDRRIPFVPWTVYIYSWVYTSMLYPLFTIRCPVLYRRMVAAYVVVVAVSLTIYALFPVTSVGLRPEVGQLDEGIFHEWAVRLTYFVDPPTNCFPSQHTSVAAIAALSAGMARPLWGLLASPIVLGILITISTMKQHYVADGLAALVLALVAYLLVLRPYRKAGVPLEDRAFSWKGPVLYLGFHSLVYLAIFFCFLGDWTPWR